MCDACTCKPSFNIIVLKFVSCSVYTGEEFTIVQKKVSDIIKGRILVGHALRHDLQVTFKFFLLKTETLVI